MRKKEAHKDDNQAAARVKAAPSLSPSPTHAPRARSASATLLGLQRTRGNRYVQRLIARAEDSREREPGGAVKGGEAAPAEVQEGIRRARGGGQPLEAGVRERMEAAFDHDFSGVRLHTDECADALSRELDAVAFTTGLDIFFRRGAYDPHSAAGLDTLSHELTHFVQQGGAAAPGPLVVAEAGDQHEREADRVAEAVTRTGDLPRGPRAASSAAHVVQLKREPDDKPRYRPESDIPLGGVEVLKAGESLRVVGFDVGSADVNKLGIKENLDDVITWLKTIDDAEVHVIISGMASESRKQGDDPYDLGQRRAEAVKKYFVEHGIKPGWIICLSHGASGAPPAATATPEEKAYWRAVFIDVKTSGKRRPGRRSKQPPKAPTAPVSDPKMAFEFMKILIPPKLIPPKKKKQSFKEFSKKAEEVAKFIRAINKAAEANMVRTNYTGAWAEAMADLTEADPAKRRLPYYAGHRDLGVELEDVEKMRISARENPVLFSRMIDNIKFVARRDAWEFKESMDPDEFENFAAEWRNRFPDYRARQQAFLKYFDSVAKW
jgi:outer membrane protein OmpA-like peptidoglycan-associated protein